MLNIDGIFNSPTREIFPEGLPPSYVFVATVRIKTPSSRMTFDLWRVLSKDKKIQAAVTLNGKDKTVRFSTTRSGDKQQRVVFKEGFQVRIRRRHAIYMHTCINTCIHVHISGMFPYSDVESQRSSSMAEDIYSRFYVVEALI